MVGDVRTENYDAVAVARFSFYYALPDNTFCKGKIDFPQQVEGKTD
jgi:hypothetical protein